MAGQKLSPRQKMINMMYLVLTALLALNVSAEVLQAFESLRNSLAHTAIVNGENNTTLARNIVKAIEKEEAGGNDKHSDLRNVVNEITSETSKIVTYLSDISKDLEEIGRKDPATGEIKFKDETQENSSYWLGTDDYANDMHGNGKAREMREELKKYVVWANELMTKNLPDDYDFSEFPLLTIEPREDTTIYDPEAKKKTWEHHSFNGTPVIADMAKVEKFKGDIRRIETEMLNLTKSLLGDYIFKVDSIFAFEAPNAQVVTAGMKYETKLLVGVSSSSIKPEFFGSGISMDPGGSTATMSMTANGNVIPNNAQEGIQRYTAMIKVPRADGTFEEMPISGEFKVRKPEVQVRSKELQLLYKDCGNNLVVDVPSLGDLYNPDFSRSTGGKIIKSPNSRKDITVVPSSRQFKLSVYTKTNGQNIKLDNLNYSVVKPPKPRIIMQNAAGTEYNGMADLNRRQTVTVKLVPDADFRAALKKDARYVASKVTLKYKSGLGAAKTIKSYNGRDIQKGIKVNLNQGQLRQAPPGTKIFIEVEGVKRVNFQNKQIDENMPRVTRVIQGIIK